MEGARRRGSLAVQLLREFPVDLSIIVFTEIHHASHRLWHTVERAPALSSPNGSGAHAADSSALLDVYREVDRQIGRLAEAAGDDATVIVFSLHGMRACRGIAALLEPLLFETGLAVRSDWHTQGWAERAQSTFAAVKRRTPPAIKNFYYKAMSKRVVTRLAQPTMLPPYDWRKTRAFSLPTDQHGWIRLNLAGREALGVVTENEYEETCEQIEEMLRELMTEDGQLLVKDVIRPASKQEPRVAAPWLRNLPDLVVHWTDAALLSSLRIKDGALAIAPVALRQTGQHALEGFCIIRGDALQRMEMGTIAARDFHSIIYAALGAG
jgi:predicted AlkP superfamily phosphohydrolase/phosphomutase